MLSSVKICQCFSCLAVTLACSKSKDKKLVDYNYGHFSGLQNSGTLRYFRKFPIQRK